MYNIEITVTTVSGQTYVAHILKEKDIFLEHYILNYINNKTFILTDNNEYVLTKHIESFKLISTTKIK